MRALFCALLLVMLADFTVLAAEVVLPGVPGRVRLAVRPPRVIGGQLPEGQFHPGRAEPVGKADIGAVRVHWDELDSDVISLVVVEPGSGLRRPATVCTLKRQTGMLEVAYPGTAFVDRDGALHVDCRRVQIAGPRADEWSPDSFAFDPNGGIRIIDDNDHLNTGKLVGRSMHPQDADGGLAYRQARLEARWYLEGIL